MTLSDTAYSCCIFRSNYEDISKDIYAKQWIPADRSSEAHAYTDIWLSDVSKNEDIAVSMRGRYFLEQLERTIKKDNIQSFLNIGAGFTSYSLLLEGKINTYEIDLEELISVKKEQLKDIAKHNNLKRLPHLISANVENIDDFKNALSQISKRPTVFLMEGLSYYLNEKSFVSIMETMNHFMQPGERFMMDYWSQDYLHDRVFLKQANFFGNQLAIKDQYFFIDEDELATLKGFRTIDTSSALTEAAKRKMDVNNLEFLPENYCVLEKI
jgi:O-methyltransferase involved in polyketide biosynthesis